MASSHPTNMLYSRRPSLDHSLSFSKWADSPDAEHDGVDGNGQPAKFISRSGLIKYWNWRMVRRVLGDDPAVNAKIDIIRSHYIRVFSILVLIDRLSCLNEFMEHSLSDERLPLERRPPQWPKHDFLDDAFEAFSQRQWKFCPLQVRPSMLTGQRLNPRHILPLTQEKVIRKSAESEVVQVKFHPDCICEKLPSSVILKAYTRPSTAESLYKAEVNAFTRIYNSAPNAVIRRPENIIDYYGHFVQNNKHCLLLEDAQDGNLETYFQTVPPPKSAADMFQFWQSMFNLLDGLTLIHNLGGPNEGSTTAYLGSHQDIKPDNILLVKKSEYDITLKIADFGMSDIWQVSDGDPNAKGTYKKGDQRYSAPECIANYDSLIRLDNRVGSEVDIWSIGCVFSEAAVWAVCGQPGLENYFQRRREETGRDQRLTENGFDGCFHNGTEPLDAIALMHTHILRSRQHWDTMTPRIIELIRQSMLLEQMGPRKSARELLQLSGRALQEARDEAQEREFVQEDSVLRPISPPPFFSNTVISKEGQVQALVSRLNSLPTLNKVTVEEVQRFRADMKGRRPPNKNVADKCRMLQSQIRGRDQMFLIDDSASMKTHHRGAVLNTFAALSYIAKRIDSNGIDLFFTSEPSRRYHEQKTTKLFGQVERNYSRNRSGGIATTMEASITEVINHIVRKQLPNPHFTFTGIAGVPERLIAQPKITLFVFTDGMWGNELSTRGVASEINRLSNHVKQRNLARTSVTIQFIRFGDNPEGIRQLKYLDDFGKENDWDIVDTKSYRDNVLDMFIGSMDNAVDNNDEEEEESPIDDIGLKIPRRSKPVREVRI
ncbi:hypothetical protein GGR53DRAFT_251582 [Hypoxylon sp. FL1150]|nr:hypothetical protein GGR53DRAFT_251582 [Hypoxylon sp. FL1150]